ncbi:MAG: peptidylprolyl isomerase [Pseudomonadota bacterium]|nr:peptidylprolyl isomerase [Pseudomonadota bacterium]
MIRALLILACMALAGLSLTAGRAVAQQVLGIAAVVNDEVISAFDLEERIDLVVFSANLPRTEDTRRRLRPQVLRTLIDEALQKQAAREIGVQVTNEDIDEGIAQIARRNDLSPAMLTARLQSTGIDPSTLRNQVLAAIAWQRFVDARLLRSVDVSDQDIDETVAELEAARGTESFLISEIVLAVDDAADAPEVQAAAERLVRQIRQGASFEALARQFSAGATAADGGDVGWVQPRRMPEAVARVLDGMKPGDVSEPVETPVGYTIIAVRDSRVLGQANADQISITLSQILLPIGRNAADADVAAARAAAEALRPQITGCENLDAVAASRPGAQASELGRLSLGDLPPDFQKALSALPVGGVTEPVRTAAGLHLLVICDRTNPAVASLDRDSVRNTIMNRKLNQRAQGYLRDLRRDAIIDLR